VKSSHPAATPPKFDTDLLSSCVHCGLCLEVCPTYQLTGDENNSPRGRLRLWREEADGRLPRDEWTDFYTSECVGCLACESACPANVPYGRIFEHVRHEHVATRRANPSLLLRGMAKLAARPSLMNWMFLPARVLRLMGLLPHRLVFPGQPSATQSTANYAEWLMSRRKPTGPKVALLTGCLMEAMFREINFATVRVLVENNVQVIVPRNQGCCGAFQEHTGLDGVATLQEQSRRVFGSLDIDAVVTNSSGCGHALGKSLKGVAPVRDVLSFLGDIGPVRQQRASNSTRVYVDLPCHLVHGQKVPEIPRSVLDATGYRWEYAPNARDCCGSGGVYNIEKPENAQAILAKKAAFLNTAEGSPTILATANHVCLMQWHSAGKTGLVKQPYQVAHVIQLLDPTNP
jgi:glycolate oxidase iron-sulfur subunit